MGFENVVTCFFVGVYALIVISVVVSLCMHYVTDGESSGILAKVDVWPRVGALIVIVPVPLILIYIVIMAAYMFLGDWLFVVVGGAALLYFVLRALRGVCRLTKKLDAHKEDKAAHGH